MVDAATLKAVFTADTKDFDKGIKKVDKSLSGLSKDMGKELRSLGGNIRGIGSNFLALTAPLAAGFGFAIHSAMNFDEQLTNIASVLGSTRAETDAMGMSLLELSKTSKFSGTELAAAMYDVVGGVADAGVHMEILAAASALAEGSNANLVGSTNALISTFNAYSSAGIEASRVSDVLTMTVRNGVGTMDELAGVFARTSTLASPLGVDIEELGVMFAQISTKGATFSEAATRIEGTLSAIINPTKELEDAFAAMGMTQEDVLKKLRDDGLISVIQDMVDAGIDLTAVFGNQEALLGALALAEIDPDALGEFTANMEGATAAAQAIQAEGRKFQWDAIVGDFNDLAVAIGMALLPAMGELITQLTPLVQGFMDWAKENPQLIADIAKVGLGVGLLGLVMFPLGVIVTGLGVAFKVLAAGIGLVTVALAVITAPITAVILGVGLGVAVFIRFGTEITTFFNKIGATVEQIAVILLGVLADITNSPFFVAIREAFETAFNFVKDSVVQPLVDVIETISTVLEALKDNPVLQLIIGAFETAFNSIKGIVEGVVNGISGFINGIKTGIEDVMIGLGLMEARASAVSGVIMPSLGNAYTAVVAAMQVEVARQENTNAVGNRKGRALGGDVFAKQSYLVGERGPELFTPQTGGNIMANNRMKGLVGGGGGGGVTITGTVNVYGVQDIQSLYNQLARVGSNRGS